MSEKQVINANTAQSFQEVDTWRHELLKIILRVVSLVALFSVSFEIFYVSNTPYTWLTPSVLGVYALLFAISFTPQIPHHWRLWIFLGILLTLAVLDLLAYGWGEDGRIYLLAAILFSSIFLSSRRGWIVLGISFLILLAFVIGVWIGILPQFDSAISPYSPLALLGGFSIFVAFSTSLFISFNYMFPRLFTALQKGIDLSRELESERAELAERTVALQNANMSLQRRASNLELSTRVVQALATVIELDMLLDHAVHLISDTFNFYHVAIFLMDEDEEYLVLSAASSAEGHRMMSNWHRVRYDGDSVIAKVAQSSQALLATDSDGVESFELPTTHSELVLPLVSGTRLIGVLDIQVSEAAILDQDDVNIFLGLAGVLAMAISNAKRLGDEASVLEAASPLYHLTRRLVTTRTEREIHTVILESLRGFDPGQAFLFHFEASSAYLVAEMRGGELAFHDQPVWAEEIRYVGEMVSFSLTVKSPVLIGDLTIPYQSGQADIDDVLVHLAEDVGILALALIPMWVGSTLLGTLVVTYTAPHYFTPLQGQLYRVLADLGGRALERIRLLQQAQTHLQNERWIREFGEIVMRIPDMATMMSQSAELLQDVSNSDAVLVSLSALDQEETGGTQ